MGDTDVTTESCDALGATRRHLKVVILELVESHAN